MPTPQEAECLKLVEDLPSLHAAAKLYAARHHRTERKRVADVVAELIAVKAGRHASARYLQDLRFRLSRLAEGFHKDTCDLAGRHLVVGASKAKTASRRIVPNSSSTVSKAAGFIVNDL